MKLTWALIGCFLSLGLTSFCQESSSQFFQPSDTLHQKRRNAVIISEASIATSSLLGLHELWYKDYQSSKFHTANDIDQWLQMDKVGHIFSSYQIGRLGAEALNWSGVSKKDQLIYGGTLGFAYLGIVEIFDGYSEEWGFSWPDLAANALGTGLFVSQELLWDEQRINLKYSFHRTAFARENPNKLGDGLVEELIKDYNGQTFWLSANLHSFFKSSKIPKWINVAVGYGGEAMLSGIPETVQNQNYNIQKPYRQFYLSLDLDLSKIETKSPFLRTVFAVFNAIKVPFPALEFNGKNGLSFHYIYF